MPNPRLPSQPSSTATTLGLYSFTVALRVGSQTLAISNQNGVPKTVTHSRTTQLKDHGQVTIIFVVSVGLSAISGFAQVVVEQCGFHHWIAQTISWGEVVSIFLYLL